VSITDQVRRLLLGIRYRESALLLVSASVLSYQVILVRAFSIGQWHHFAYMVISIALLGFGASGTLLAVLERKRTSTVARFKISDESWFAISATLFAIALPVSFWLTQRIPFDPFLIIWDWHQALYLGGYYLALCVPFFAAATAIGLALTSEPADCPRLYAFNMAGSGAGALLALELLSVAAVEWALVGVTALAQAAAILALFDGEFFIDRGARRRFAVAIVAIMALLTLTFVFRPPTVRLSQYKGLSYALNLPDAKVVAERSSPLGRVDVVASPAIREAPGLSLLAPMDAVPPPQLGLYIDAESAGAITAFDGDTSKLNHLDWMITAAPYFALPDAPPDLRVCVLGAGGGAGVLLALRHAARQVDAVELDPNVLQLLRGEFRDFAGGLYDRPEVRVHRADARAYVQAAHEKWNVIDLSLVDSFAASAVGVGAVGENYLYTREAFEAFLHHLRPGGVLAVTRWVRTPPRDELKLFATGVAALERMGLNPAERLVLIRSWAAATLLVKKEAFTAQELFALRRWAEERLFDTSYFPGIAADQHNRFNVLERDYYFEATNAFLAGGESREQFFRDYAFNLRPATDNRPYFFHFFRWRALPLMLRTFRQSSIPFSEWGYLILVATLAQAILLGVLLIASPLVLLPRRSMPNNSPIARPLAGRAVRLQVFFYFLALGLGYLFVEMVLIQRLVLFLANPDYAVAVVLAGLLFVSGWGSAWAGRQLRKGTSGTRLACLAALIVAFVSTVYAFGLHALLTPLLGLPLPTRMVLAFAVMVPLAAMGIPFPIGLRQLGQSRAELLPWAWAINGCASVLAGPLATLFALGAGLPALLLAASGCYVVAALVANMWQTRLLFPHWVKRNLTGPRI
jgi:Spermine/spermidine synthase domain